MIDTLTRDLRYAARVLRKTPGFTFTALVTLALTIGANTAVFSIVDALMFKPLPYPKPERLALMATRYENAARGLSGEQTAVDGRTWEIVRDNIKSMHAAAYSGWIRGVNLVTPAGAAFVQQQRVSAGFFRVLGVPPLIGREFAPHEDQPNGPALAVLTYDVWQSTFNGDPAVVGKAIHLRGEPHEVIGVMPKGFVSSGPVDLFTPLRASTRGEGEGTNYALVLRLEDDYTMAQADAELAALGAERRREQPRGEGWTAQSFAMPFQRAMTPDSLRTQLIILWGAVAVVLLIACINLAGLMLARAGTRQREIATRMAIGSGRAAVVRQLFVESLLIAIAGGAAGVALGWAGLQVLSDVAFEVFGIWQPLEIDGRVLAVTVAITIGAALVFGLAPSWQASRIDVQPALVETGTRGSTSASRWPRRMLIVAEVALGVALLVCAGLLVRTFVNLRGLQPGFDATGVVAATISLDDARYRDPARAARLFEETSRHLRELPGVEAAAVSLGVPYQRLLNLGFERLDGGGAAGQTGTITNLSYVTAEFFGALDIPIKRGRAFDHRDTAESEGVVVVNDAFAERYFKGEDPIGHRIATAGRERQIVGISGNVRLSNPGWGDFGPIGAPPIVYVPATQTSEGFLTVVHTWFQPVWIVRSSRGVQEIDRAIRAEVASADPQLPVADVVRMEEVVSRATAGQRFMAMLLVVLGVIAALLAAIGIHGLIAASVTERTRELGIRMALGASAGQAMRTVALTGVALAAAGVVLGGLLAAWAVRLLQSLLWGVEPIDPATFGSVVAMLFLVALVASILPALRVLRMDPAETLRAE